MAEVCQRALPAEILTCANLGSRPITAVRIVAKAAARPPQNLSFVSGANYRWLVCAMRAKPLWKTIRIANQAAPFRWLFFHSWPWHLPFGAMARRLGLCNQTYARHVSRNHATCNAVRLMVKKQNLSNEMLLREKEYFEELLKLPGARKARQGVIIDSEHGSFHARSLAKIVEDLPVCAQFYLEFCTESEARRILNVKNAHDYLLKRRADAIADSPRLIRQISYRKSEWESRSRAWSLTNYYNTLNAESKEYIRSLPRRGQRLFSSLPYGRVPLLQPNGLCFRSLVGDIVMVSDTLHYFLYFSTLANLGTFYDLTLEQRAHAFLIALRIMNGVESLDFDMDPREKLPAKLKSEVLQDVSWMVQFTFAHEFAHFTLGHLDATPAENEHEITFAHNLEYEADAQAVCLHGINSYRAGKLAWAAHQVFLAFHAIERVGRARKDFPDFSLSKTHPGPVDRIKAIQDLKVRNNSANQDILDDAIAATDDLVDTVLDWIEGDDRCLSFYGSVYMPGFSVGKAVDRIDF